mgnify:CR=1 FL=1
MPSVGSCMRSQHHDRRKRVQDDSSLVQRYTTTLSMPSVLALLVGRTCTWAATSGMFACNQRRSLERSSLVRCSVLVCGHRCVSAYHGNGLCLLIAPGQSEKGVVLLAGKTPHVFVAFPWIHANLPHQAFTMPEIPPAPCMHLLKSLLRQNHAYLKHDHTPSTWRAYAVLYSSARSWFSNHAMFSHELTTIHPGEVTVRQCRPWYTRVGGPCNRRDLAHFSVSKPTYHHAAARDGSAHSSRSKVQTSELPRIRYTRFRGRVGCNKTTGLPS